MRAFFKAATPTVRERARQKAERFSRTALLRYKIII
jgi:hypothetical protein